MEARGIMTDAQREHLGYQRIGWGRRTYLGVFGPLMGAAMIAFGVLCAWAIRGDAGLLIMAVLVITGLVVAGSGLWSIITGWEKPQ
jgi:hypothetical protein